MDQVTFRTDIFPKYPNEDEEIINSNRWGKRLAEYLHRELAKMGTDTAAIYPEDWGWVVEISDPDFNAFVGCAVSDDSDNEFLVFVEVSQPFFKKLFNKKDPGSFMGEICASLGRTLEENSEIEVIEWS